MWMAAISSFVLGGIVTIVGIIFMSWFVEKKKENYEKKKKEMENEEAGWIILENFPDWREKNEMNKWYKSIRSELDLYYWLRDHIKGNWKIEYLNGKRYIKFDKDEDAVAFKLWST